MALRDWLGRLRGRERKRRHAEPGAPEQRPPEPARSRAARPPHPTTSRRLPRPAPTRRPPPPPAPPPPVRSAAGTPRYQQPRPSRRRPPPRLRPSAPAPLAAEAPPPQPSGGGGWLSRLRGGLQRTTARLTESVTALFRKRRLDDEALEELEETLIAADLGVSAAPAHRRRLPPHPLRQGSHGRGGEGGARRGDRRDPRPRRQADGDQARARARTWCWWSASTAPARPPPSPSSASNTASEGLSCAFVAGDTFRAAAVEQLQIWGERTGCPVHAPRQARRRRRRPRLRRAAAPPRKPARRCSWWTPPAASTTRRR